MLYYVTPGCTDISEVDDLPADIKTVIARSAKVRDITLTRCYEIPGYAAMSREDKIKIYDKIQKEVEAELTDTF